MEKTARAEATDNVLYEIHTDVAHAEESVHVLNYGDTFCIGDRMGNIRPTGKGIQGIYHRDTRYISKLEFRINGKQPTLLSSSIKEENEILSVDLTNPSLTDRSGISIEEGTLHLKRSQFVRANEFREEIAITGYHAHACELELTLDIQGDFKDMFEIRGTKRAARGEQLPCELIDNRRFVLSYRGLDKTIRRAVVSFPVQVQYEKTKGNLYCQIRFRPGDEYRLSYAITFTADGMELPSDEKAYEEAKELLMPYLNKAKAFFPVIETSNEQFTHWVNRSQADLVSLMADTPYGKYPYAGVPWYNTAFGRDGIITALETLWAAPNLSRDVLLFLAANQADCEDPASDAEPGKILHETRGGEMVALNEVPFRKYYGTIDATPLFVMLAGEYFVRTADEDTIRQIWPNIKAALLWIELYGDSDGDGFVEYRHKAENGLTNQGWKDSHDSISHQNGELADPAIALCEVQGYVYAAKKHASALARIVGEESLARKWQLEADQLKQRFNEVFWDDRLNCYVLALDGKKKPCRVVSSNAGHTLYTGIADEDKAIRLAETLLSPQMFSGWGIRTLSTTEKRYNPMSYHNGTVWPHDVAIIAAGMSRYGMTDAVMKLTTGLFNASLFIQLQRLPELFCGFVRRPGEGPTAYPVACSPQAWSVGAVFMLLQSMLHLRFDPRRQEISLHRPALPDYLCRIRLSGLQVGDISLTLDIERHHNDKRVSVHWPDQPHDWKLIVEW